MSKIIEEMYDVSIELKEKELEELKIQRQITMIEERVDNLERKVDKNKSHIQSISKHLGMKEHRGRLYPPTEDD